MTENGTNKKKVITIIWKKIFFQKGKNDATHFLSIKYGRIKLVKERIKSTRVTLQTCNLDNKGGKT
jgi:hypothetical protein